jgi:hypothetical protein
VNNYNVADKDIVVNRDKKKKVSKYKRYNDKLNRKLRRIIKYEDVTKLRRS